jgi:hypothetical protein
MKSLIAASFAALAFAGSSIAQVTAHQGTQDPNEFHSPMIVEIPLPDLTHLSPGQSRIVSTELSKYVCDDTNLNGILRVEVKKPGRAEAGKMVLEFGDTVHVRKSHDRLVDITFAVKSGDTVLGKGSMPTRSIEEKDTRPFTVRVATDESAVRQAFTSPPGPTLEITVAVRDND